MCYDENLSSSLTICLNSANIALRYFSMSFSFIGILYYSLSKKKICGCFMFNVCSFGWTRFLLRIPVFSSWVSELLPCIYSYEMSFILTVFASCLSWQRGNYFTRTALLLSFVSFFRQLDGEIMNLICLFFGFPLLHNLLYESRFSKCIVALALGLLHTYLLSSLFCLCCDLYPLNSLLLKICWITSFCALITQRLQLLISIF